MRIAIIDHYSADSSPHKDPISIPRGLAALGHNIELVTLDQYDQNRLFDFKVQRLSNWLAHGLEIDSPDAVIAISRFNPALTHVLQAIKAKRVPLIVKGDTDGSIGYPIPPNYLRTRPITAHPINVLRQIKWRAPVSFFVKQKIKHIQLADLVVCESPGAAVNLASVLDYWGLSSQIGKIAHIPNSISKIYTETPIAGKHPHTIVSVGRWDDMWCKGSDLLAETISNVLSHEHDAQFVVIGNNPEYVKRRQSNSISDRVRYTGSKDFSETHSLVSSAQILLVPSRLESFSLVSGEALCTGASLVVTPIESLLYLSGGGAFGSIARDFSASAISSALLYELHLWDRGVRKPDVIASYWRAELSEDSISSIWNKELERL